MLSNSRLSFESSVVAMKRHFSAKPHAQVRRMSLLLTVACASFSFSHVPALAAVEAERINQWKMIRDVDPISAERLCYAVNLQAPNVQIEQRPHGAPIILEVNMQKLGGIKNVSMKINGEAALRPGWQGYISRGAYRTPASFQKRLQSGELRNLDVQIEKLDGSVQNYDLDMTGSAKISSRISNSTC